jgi:DNA-binding response OmpR family regulator
MIMKKKILVVEDDESIRDILKIMLTKAGFEVEDIKDGSNLLNGRASTADLYLIDRQLSGVDGLDLCRHLKGEPLTAKTPVIILSATPGIERLVDDAGASAFIEKPFSKKNLLETIESVISKSKVIS